ncbi:hypothetical protein GQ457_11G000850 [Hibiscus cannabinus]
MTTSLFALSPLRHHHCFTYSSPKSFDLNALQSLILSLTFQYHHSSFFICLCSNSNTLSLNCLSTRLATPSPHESTLLNPHVSTIFSSGEGGSRRVERQLNERVLELEQRHT